MNKRLDTPHGGFKWRCDGCGRWAYWTADHSWYGSIRDAEDGNWDGMWIACSERCKTGAFT